MVTPILQDSHVPALLAVFLVTANRDDQGAVAVLFGGRTMAVLGSCRQTQP